jgi:hypothetical protein
MPPKGIHRPSSSPRSTDSSYAEQQAEQNRKLTVEAFDEPNDILWDTPLNHFENTEVEDLLEGIEQEEEALYNAFDAFFADEEGK